MLSEKWNGCLQHRGLVHLPVVLTHHGAQLRDQHVELVPSLLLRQVPWLPLGLVLLIIILHVVSRHGEGGRPTTRCYRCGLHYFRKRHLTGNMFGLGKILFLFREALLSWSHTLRKLRMDAWFLSLESIFLCLYLMSKFLEAVLCSQYII